MYSYDLRKRKREKVLSKKIGTKKSPAGAGLNYYHWNY